jgi:fermentation-respiration switch protein FrsA (DUF1100 family)
MYAYMRDLSDLRSSIDLDVGSSQPVPALLQLPCIDRRVPAVLLVHGLTSRKEDMADSIGRALVRRDIASLAIDLPLHGARSRGARAFSFRNPMTVIETWRLALCEAGCAITYLARHAAIDDSRIAISGYSVGAYISMILAASEPRISAIALTAGGDLPPGLPFMPLIRTMIDPLRAVQALNGRPLLLMNGTRDRRIPPAQATTLFEAAGQPKELRWYDGGHWPPPSAVESVADWLAIRLAARPSALSEQPAALAGSSPPPPRRSTEKSPTQTPPDPSR